MRTSARRGGRALQPLLSLHSRTAVRRHLETSGPEETEQVMENEIGMARSKHGEGAYQILVGTTEGKRNN
jgi:hypothetical protein